MSLLPVIQPAPDGMSDRPMTVITVPVTTGGKNRMTRAKNGTMMIATTPATRVAPNADSRPALPSLPMMATRVATEANEMPWTTGSWAPR